MYSVRTHCMLERPNISPKIVIVRSVQFEKRMDKYREQSFLPQHLEIHWFSIINSSVLVLLLLVILVTIFTRVLKHDFAKFSRDEELGDEAEETGAASDIQIYRTSHKQQYMMLLTLF